MSTQSFWYGLLLPLNTVMGGVEPWDQRQSTHLVRFPRPRLIKAAAKQFSPSCRTEPLQNFLPLLALSLQQLTLPWSRAHRTVCSAPSAAWAPGHAEARRCSCPGEDKPDSLAQRCWTQTGSEQHCSHSVQATAMNPALKQHCHTLVFTGKPQQLSSCCTKGDPRQTENRHGRKQAKTLHSAKIITVPTPTN